ncbi:MAG: hypothetical protein JW855_03805 [Gammaproteobacteria bacterium]|nr:hypothetical protein [Gammaproteobacteria bacterium]
MLRKLFCTVMVIIAVVLAILGITLPREHLQWIIYITNFFDIMIPVLAVAGIINYLMKSNACCETK